MNLATTLSFTLLLLTQVAFAAAPATAPVEDSTPLQAELADPQEEAALQADEIVITETEEEFQAWVDEKQMDETETAYVDQEGNEYFVSNDEVAALKKSGRLRKKRSGHRRSTNNSCSAHSGVASWYGGRFHGRKTASGERFNQNAMTAAHKTLRFGSLVRVSYHGRSIQVRINDNGPHIRGRVIDLSKGAARSLGLPGTGAVQLNVIRC